MDKLTVEIAIAVLVLFVCALIAGIIIVCCYANESFKYSNQWRICGCCYQDGCAKLTCDVVYDYQDEIRIIGEEDDKFNDCANRDVIENKHAVMLDILDKNTTAHAQNSNIVKTEAKANYNIDRERCRVNSEPMPSTSKVDPGDSRLWQEKIYVPGTSTSRHHSAMREVEGARDNAQYGRRQYNFRNQESFL